MRRIIEFVRLTSVAVLVGLFLVAPSVKGADARKPGTIKMAERLASVAAKVDPLKHPFLSRERVKAREANLSSVTNSAEGVLAYATDLMNANQNERALEWLRGLETALRTSRPEEYEKRKTGLKMQQAICWLRIAELRNCLENHNAESCLLPIAGGGVHKTQEPSRKALEILTALLQENPDNLDARWLLNIASMTLGEYPDKTHPQYRIPPEAFASEHALGRFADVSAGTGLDVDQLSGAAVLEDFDNDGFLDVVTTSIGFQDQMRFFRNKGDGTYEDRSLAAGLEGLTGGLNAVQADYNNDGWTDLFVLRGGWMREQGKFPNSLLKNNGDGTFEDVTEAAGVLRFAPTQTGVWLDFDSDGWLDLFVGNESVTSEGQNYPCELYRNNRDGTFTECAREAGVDFLGYVKGVTAGDYNNDGHPDLFLSVAGQANVLFRNLGIIRTDAAGKPIVRFRNVAQLAKVTEPIYSFPCWFFDYDNDGWEDLIVAGYNLPRVGHVAADYLGLPHGAERLRLYRNNQAGIFENVTAAMGLDHVVHAMGANFGDLDSDGFLDAYFGTGDPDLGTIIPNRMFRNNAAKGFQDVSTAGGFGHLQKGHGVAFGDINNDGAQDIYHDLGGAVSGDTYRNALFANPGHTNQWIVLKLEGVQSNRSAIGARIRVDIETPAGTRTIWRTVSSGGSFGASPLRQEIGLGNATVIKAVEVRWPGAKEPQRFTGLALRKAFTLRQGEAQPKEIALKTYVLKPASSHHHHH